MDKSLDFQNLVEGIIQVHQQAATQANKAVNVSLTLRNWGPVEEPPKMTSRRSSP